MEEPRVNCLLAKHGGALDDVKGIASILNRREPSREEIQATCLHTGMYFPFPEDAYPRLSLKDEDWIENQPLVGANQYENYTSAAQRMREWTPQTTITSTTANAGSQGGVPSIKGLQMGFMSGRQALAHLPPEQLTYDNNPKKRKAEIPGKAAPTTKTAGPVQKPLKSFMNPDDIFNIRDFSLPSKPSVSSGIVQERGKPLKRGRLIPRSRLSSSPDLGVNVDALPSVSFSSPSTTVAAKEEIIKENNLITSPLMPGALPLSRKPEPYFPAPQVIPNPQAFKGWGRMKFQY